MIVIRNTTGLVNGYALFYEEDLKLEDPQPIMSGLTYDQAEREYLRRKEKETSGNGVLQDRGGDRG